MALNKPFLCLSRFLPKDFRGFPFSALSPKFLAARNRTLWAVSIELAFALCSLPLGGARGGIARLSMGVNILLMFVAAWGIFATLRLEGFWVLCHAVLVFGLILIFLAYIALVAGAGDGIADEGDFVLVLVFAFVLVDFAVAFFTSYFSWCIHKETVRLKAMPAAELSRAVAATADVTATVAVPVAPPVPRPRATVATQGNSTTSASSVSMTTNSNQGGGDDDNSCVVCLEKPRNCLIYRCGHIAVCWECGQRLKSRSRPCPLCRAPIEDVVRAFGGGVS